MKKKIFVAFAFAVLSMSAFPINVTTSCDVTITVSPGNIDNISEFMEWIQELDEIVCGD